MSDVKDTNGATTSVAGGESSAKALPAYVKDNLGKEIFEDWSKRIESDAEFAKSVPATLPEFAKTWDSERSERAKIAKKLQEVEEGRKAPNSPQDYALAKIELPKGMVYTDRLKEAFAKGAEEFAQWAHAEKLPVETARRIYEKSLASRVEQIKAITYAQEAQAAEMAATRDRDVKALQDALRTQWGDAYDGKMPRNMTALKNPVMIPQDVVAALDKSGLLRSPSFQLWWDRQVSMMSNDRKLGLKGEEGEGLEPDENEGKASIVDKNGKAHLKPGFFKSTDKRYPKRRAS